MSIKSASFLFCLAATTATSISAFTVSDSECPSPAPSFYTTVGCPIASQVCDREDSAASITAVGSPDLQNSATQSCTNCVGCPDQTPPDLNCNLTLSLSYTNTITVSLSAQISASAAVVSGALTNEFGVSFGSQRTYSTNCGTNSLPGCTTASYAATLSTLDGAQTTVNSTYYWVTSWPAGCGSATWTSCGLPVQSTATANYTTGSLSCTTTANGNCGATN